MIVDAAALARSVDERAGSASELDRLRAAVAVADELRADADELLDRCVQAARQGGCSWAQIGVALGVTRQAAHERFLHAERAPLAWPPHGSESVRAAFVVAEREARTLGHCRIGTEHVLLGLLACDERLATRVLEPLGVTRHAILERIRHRVGVAPATVTGELGVAPRLKKVLEAARGHARALGQGCTSGEHLLVAMTEVTDCVAARILEDLGCPPERVVTAVAHDLGLDAGDLRTRSRRGRRRRVRPQRVHR